MKLPVRFESDFARVRVTRAAWVSAAVGAAVGIGSAWLAPQRKSRYGMLLGGVVGGSLGYGGAAIAGSAIRKVNDFRDARWLEKNPIAYA